MEQEKQKATVQEALTINTVEMKDEGEDEFDLFEFVYVLLHHWKQMVVAGLIGTMIMVGYYGLFVENIYRASTQMYITSTDSVISLQDLQIGSQLTEDYKTIILSRAVLNKVIEDLRLDTDYKGLAKLISVSNPSGTHIITTSVTTTDIETSRNIANDLLSVSVDYIYQIVGTSAPSVIDYSEVEAVDDVTPSLMKFMVIGCAVGVLVVMAYVVIKMLMDNTIKSDDDVEKYLKLPVLAAVPYYDD